MATNPAYAHLTHRLAILEHMSNYLLENCVGPDESPAVEISNPYLSSKDSRVPRDEVIHFLDDMRITASRVEDEMNKFDFVRRDNAGIHTGGIDAVYDPPKPAERQPPAAASAEVPQPQAGQKGRRRRGRRR